MLKGSRKAKTLLKEKTALLPEDEGHLFGKKFRSHIIETERSKKKSLEVFKGNNDKNTPFQKGTLPYRNRPQGGGRYYYTTNQVIETKTKMFNFKTTRAQVPESFIMQVQRQMVVNTSFTIQKEVSVTSNSEMVPLIKIATLEHVHPIMKKLFTKNIPNVPLAGRLAYFIAAWVKLLRIKKYHLL